MNKEKKEKENKEKKIDGESPELMKITDAGFEYISKNKKLLSIFLVINDECIGKIETMIIGPKQLIIECLKAAGKYIDKYDQADNTYNGNYSNYL